MPAARVVNSLKEKFNKCVRLLVDDRTDFTHGPANTYTVAKLGQQNDYQPVVRGQCLIA